MTVLAITGSSGHVGGRVARLLGGEVDRLIARDPARVLLLPHEPEVRIAAYGDREAAESALQGVDVLFMVSAAESPTRRDEHRAFIDAAAAAGVGHIVYTSFVGAGPDAHFTLGRDHGDAERAIRESGMAFTLLRDNLYSDFLPMLAGPDGVIRGPAGDGRLAAVARADVADVAATVLRSPAEHAGEVYALTGPESLTLTEIAQRLTAALGTPIRFEDETLEQAYESRRPFSDEQWQLDAWVSTYTAVKEGEVAEVSDDVERLTGHPARPIETALAAQA